jgi:hypothetical protein
MRYALNRQATEVRTNIHRVGWGKKTKETINGGKHKANILI